MKKRLIFILLISSALLAFEVFNFDVTERAFIDILGEAKAFGILWATILATAFCSIDFAGIARLFAPVKPGKSTKVWWLFGGWMLAALMNAMLTWWGVSVTVLDNQTLGNSLVSRETMLEIVPVALAITAWLIRTLIIGTIVVAGEGIFAQHKLRKSIRSKRRRPKSHRSRRPRS